MPWHLQHLAAGCRGSVLVGWTAVTLPLFPQALLPVLAKRGIVPNLQTFLQPGQRVSQARRLQLLSDMRVSGPRLRRPQGWGVGASESQASVLRVSSREHGRESEVLSFK